jgi:hypothetical protein
LTNIDGCGVHLEKNLQARFFEILDNILKRLKDISILDVE